MQTHEIREILVQLLVEEYNYPGDRTVLDNEHFSQMGMDSLEEIEFKNRVEEKFNIEFSPLDYDNAHNIGDLILALSK